MGGGVKCCAKSSESVLKDASGQRSYQISVLLLSRGGGERDMRDLDEQGCVCVCVCVCGTERIYPQAAVGTLTKVSTHSGPCFMLVDFRPLEF